MTQKHRRIMLVMDWFDQRLYEGVLEYAARHNWEICGSPHLSYRVPRSEADGLLIVPGVMSSQQRVMHKYRGRTVIMHSISDNLKDPCVMPDTFRMGQMAAEHFIERGFKNLAVMRLWTEDFAEPAVQGFQHSCRSAGIPPHAVMMPGQDNTPQDEHTHDLRLDWLTQQLADLPKPAGVFLPIDTWASLALRACRRAELNVPESVAILGMNNTPIYCQHQDPPLSSVDSNLKAVGYEAARLLDCKLAGEPVYPQIYKVAPKGVIARRSTDSLAIPDLRVARAVRYIQDNFKNWPTCGDIAVFTGTNLRTLQAAFRRNLGHSIGAEIIHQRINSIKTALRETNQTTQQIADAHNYSSVFVLYRQFKTQTGITMRQYRLQLGKQA